MTNKKGKNNKDLKTTSQDVPAKKVKITPAALIAIGLGLACIVFGMIGVVNGKPGGNYLAGLGLLFIAAISIGWMKNP